MTNKKTSDYLVEGTIYFSKLPHLKLKSIEPKSVETLLLPTIQYETYHNLILNDRHNILPLQKLELPAAVGFLDFSYESLMNYFSSINIFGANIYCAKHRVAYLIGKLHNKY